MKDWLKKLLSPDRTEAAPAHAPAEKPDAAAYLAFNAGELTEAAAAFGTLIAKHSDRSDYSYMLGLAHKYQRDWAPSLDHNIRAIALSSSKPEEGANWNAAIAATALGRWREARRHWAACGIKVEPGDEPIEDNYGTVSLRLNPWGGAETLYARRIDPARAYLANIPLPESGYRFRDLVLHDGAKTGEREFDGRMVPVFNVMQMQHQSDFITFAAFVVCPSEEDRDALHELSGPGIGLTEDWTAMSHYCLRCSYGSVHKHTDASCPVDWEPDRTVGVAARAGLQSSAFSKSGRPPARSSCGVYRTEGTPAERAEDGCVWWREPESDSV